MGSSAEPPRSWKKEDKEFFLTLPLHAQEIIARREQEREIGLRRKQNELAEAIKEAKRSTDGTAKSVDNTVKESTHAD